MSVNLSKGQRINLSKEVEGLSKIMVGLGWDAAKQSGGILNHLFGSTSYSIDCDASAITMGNGNKSVSYTHLEFSLLCQWQTL